MKVWVTSTGTGANGSICAVNATEEGARASVQRVPAWVGRPWTQVAPREWVSGPSWLMIEEWEVGP